MKLRIPEGGLHFRSFRRWVIAIVLALVSVFVAITWLQFRQFGLLSGTAQFRDDNTSWSFYQLENEALKFLITSREALASPDEPDIDALTVRYDILYSRVGVVQQGPGHLLMAGDAAYEGTIARLMALLDAEQAYFAEQGAKRLTRAQLAGMTERLAAMGEEIHDLTLSATARAAARIDERNTAIRDQVKASLALTIVQCLLIFLFAWIAMRQLRMLTRRQEQLETLARELEEKGLEARLANRAKTAFLANMSHEIRTPLNGMLGMLALLKDTPTSAEQDDLIDTAREAAEHLLSLLNNILDLSRMESAKLEVVPIPTDLPLLIRQVEGLMTRQAVAKGLMMTVSVDGSVPQWVQVDPTRLRQILFNLLHNAIKFTERGAVMLNVEASKLGDGRDEVRLIVADTGIGMDDATRQRLFQRFTQGDSSTMRRYGGSGLGLEISRSLARLMDGDIIVQSEEGKGSVFTVALPLSHADAPVFTDVQPDDSPLPVRGLSILAADDNPVNRKFLAGILKKLGHRVQFAQHGAEAVALAACEPFDVILMDLHMPVMDGMEALAEIRRLPPPLCSVPVVAVTADAFAETRDRVMAAGMDGFLSKPLDVEACRRVLAELCSAGRDVMDVVDAQPGSSDGDAPPAWLDAATAGELLEVLGRDSYADLLETFFRVENPTAELGEALSGGDVVRLRDRAHALKGSALNLGLSDIGNLARDIEQAARQGRIDGIEGRIVALGAAWDDTLAAARRDGWIGG
ncbi:ATP-binding protein [Paludibacterium paludis]|uniref:Virulence sensor protein BvgS n=1 Tax=Paludibacterium paludis TaxID=1225769 RepID=A0A918NYQ2_9NEIS|nr:ATP-binding protein [Paludibacterium paludis]GGY06299.1 hypothetical protein GCM10011289_05960 [Paludibacterium paludis]